MNAAPRPFLPTEVERLRPSDHLIRAARVSMLTDAMQDPAGVLTKLYPEDRATMAVMVKAAVAPATTTTVGWAAELAQHVVADFVASLAAYGAAGQLFERAAKVDMARIDTIAFPRRAAGPGTLGWVAENSPIPVYSRSLSGVQLGPARKLAGIAVLSRSLAKGAHGEETISLLLREDAARSLDAALFSTAAGSASAHAGLLNGLTPLTGYAGGDDAARATDLQGLTAALTTAGATGVVFVAAPRQALALQMQTSLKVTVLASAALADGVVIALDPAGLVFGYDPTPEIDVSEAGVVHMSDDPLPIVASATAADPVRSLWQTDAIALRLILTVAWATRAPGAVAYLTGASWG